MPALARQPARLDTAQPATGAARARAGDSEVRDARGKPAVQPVTDMPVRGEAAGSRLAHAPPGDWRAAADQAPQGQARLAGDASLDVSQVAQVVEPAAPTPSPPLQQIADRIATTLAADSKGPAGPASTPGSGPAAHPLKVLTIQLHPVELGSVSVRIALKGDALELQVEASREDTARLIDADRDRLSGLLRSAGYQVEAMVVRAVDPPAAPASAGPSHEAANGAPQSQPDGSQADARPWRGQTHREQDGDPHGTRRDTTRGEPDGLRHRAGRGLYV